ncbi:hypothetical protein K9B33_11320 [Sphingobium sp. 3R8]|uniref:hypothetical protein n=1 Tax=Sphingobium sp. 3R8 TaxID=2874921 RepID=UPI001CC95184|nr:hypothetical protein [Sphingobium sp. 3R8]MBZ9648139.1 hypothetical protein [Sphingobium sp. 3R8]
MGRLYLSDHEIAAITAIDTNAVREGVRHALDEGGASALRSLHLSATGENIGHHLNRFERDLAAHTKAKAAPKRKETWSRAWDSGQDLIYAVHSAKERAEKQQVETQLLFIDDQIRPPYRFSDRVEVDVHYRWRGRPEDPWNFGTIAFFHDVDLSRDYTVPQPARKLSRAKAEAQREATLFDRWDHLRMLALDAVREYLTTGGDASLIPKRYEAKPDRNDRHLNNFSCDFWEAIGEPRGRRRPPARLSEQLLPTSASQASTPDGLLTLDARVRHKMFGDGVVTHIEGDKIVADFGDRGSKRVMASFVELITDRENG